MKQFTTYSDAGSVRVGNEQFTILLSNGYGDGYTKVTILEDNEQVPRNFKFNTMINGKFNIYEDDCSGEKIITTLNGKYGVYYNGEDDQGEVLFEKWK